MHTLQISIMQDVIEPNSLYLESNYYGLRENKQLKNVVCLMFYHLLKNE